MLQRLEAAVELTAVTGELLLALPGDELLSDDVFLQLVQIPNHLAVPFEHSLQKENHLLS